MSNQITQNFLEVPQIYQIRNNPFFYQQKFDKKLSIQGACVKSRKQHLKTKSIQNFNEYCLQTNKILIQESQFYFPNKKIIYVKIKDRSFKIKKSKNQKSCLQCPNQNIILPFPYKKDSITTTESFRLNSTPHSMIQRSFTDQKSIISIVNEQKSLLTIQDFDILSYIGEGVSGSVYKVLHLKSNSVYALKKIDKNSLQDQIEKQALMNQARIHNKLNHPNIIKFYDVFSGQNSIYFLIELSNEGNLYEILRRRKTFAEKQVRKIIFQICSALNYLHKKNIFHRDIKAENIVIHENVAKICDFGWAIEGNISKNFLCGTPAYISPEVIQQKLYDNKIDVWSMGILMFELIYGHLPFRITSQNDLQKIVLDDLQFPESRYVSENCKNFMQKCLQKQAKKRWNTQNLLEHKFLKTAS